MLILFFYLIENIIIARYLEKKNMKIASVAHVILFMFFSMYLLFPPFSSFSVFKEIFIAKDLYTQISEVINEPTNIAYFTFSISTFVSIVMLLMLIISITLVGILLIEVSIEMFKFTSEKLKRDENYFCTYTFVLINKIFKLNCCYRN